MNSSDDIAGARPLRAAPPLAGLLVLAGLVMASCGDRAATGAPGLQRFIETTTTSPSTAALARVEIGADTRYVLSSQPRHLLRHREDVTIDGDVSVDVDLPDELAGLGEGRTLRIDAWVSLPDPSAREQTLIQRRADFRGRHVFRARPQIVTIEEGAASWRRSRTTIPVSPEFADLPGLLSVAARPLPDTAVTRHVTDEVAIPDGSRLVFGYAVEEDGWVEGWPAVAFRVIARDGDEEHVIFDRRIDPVADARDRRWFDAAVDLSRVAGGRVRLVFETEALAAGEDDAVRTFAVFSNPRVVPAARASDRPNVILISLDTLRAQSVGSYGYPRDTTPSMDARVAAAGVRFEQAVAPAPYTPPSHMSMLTGLDPCAHQVGVVVGDAVLPESITTLTELLRAADYETAAFTENGYLVAGAGFDRGFDRYVEQRSEETAAPGFAAETFTAAEEWLAGAAGRPFFLFIHTYSVHGPYTPPRGYTRLFDDEVGDRYKPKFREVARSYDQEIRYTDDVVAGFLDALEVHGLADDTILIITSDHGEGFGEHGLTGHGFSLHDEAVLVPLLVRAPGRVPAGRVITEQVGLIDLTPTVLELVGLPALAGVQGHSLAGLLAGDGAFRERPLVIAMGEKMHAVRTREIKYIKGRGEVLFRLDEDPAERRNLVTDEPNLLADARRTLALHAEACEQARASASAAEARASSAQKSPAWQIDREEIDRKLRSLGYLD